MKANWSPEQLLKWGLDELRIELNQELVIQQLLTYLKLLKKWNKVYNLTSLQDERSIIIHHFLDSLSVLPWIKGNFILDVGTGAGFPGIPLAVVKSNDNFYLLDSLSKRIYFLNQVLASLQLSNVSVLHERIEYYKPTIHFDCIISRAFSNIDLFLSKIQPLCGKDTQILAMKGQYPSDELANISDKFEVREVKALKVPGCLDYARHLVILQHRGDREDGMFSKGIFKRFMV